MSKPETYPNWDSVPDHLATKTQLGKLGLKPARNQEPVAYKRNYYRGSDYALYDINEAVPKRTMSAKQRAALERARRKAMTTTCCQRYVGVIRWRYRGDLCYACWTARQAAEHKAFLAEARAGAIRWARAALADPGAVILDTETTDLDGEPVEVAIIDMDGRPLLDTLVKATEPVEPDAERVHGITAAMLEDAPSFPDIYPELGRILEAASRIIIYNAQFDFDILERARKIHTLPFYPCAEIEVTPYIDIDGQEREIRTCHRWRGLACAMEQYAAFCGDWSEYYGSFRWPPLPGGGHRALGDCRATLAVIRMMAEERL